MSNEVDLSVSLYDMNKSLMANEKPLDPILLNRKIADVAKEMNRTGYFMLLNKERSDYTIFYCSGRTTESCKQEEISETIKNRGHVLSIDRTKDSIKNWEIWIRDFDTEENFCYYLFECDQFVVEV